MAKEQTRKDANGAIIDWRGHSIHKLKGSSGTVYTNFHEFDPDRLGYQLEDYLLSSSADSSVVSKRNEREHKFYIAETPKGSKVFVKRVRRHSNELEFYKRLQEKGVTHPAIIPLLDTIGFRLEQLLVFPFVPASQDADYSMTLLDFIKLDMLSQFPEKDQIIRAIGLGLADFLDFLNTNNMIYLDLKPTNVLYSLADTSPDAFPLKFIDFESVKIGERVKKNNAEGNLNGASHKKSDNDHRDKRTADKKENESLIVRLKEGDNIIFTPLYSAPEILAHDPVLFPQSDVYSLCCILYDFFCGPREYNGLQEIFAEKIQPREPSTRKLVIRMKEKMLGDYGFLTPNHAETARDIPQDIKEMMVNCFSSVPQDRYTPAKLKLLLEKQIKRYARGR
ncbi:hypothetical protein HY636_01095 [Candidatus Woesearchaeota archaeon]|nr:hypothetical protein [Candidatus Woesearchaeota archaeon]